MSKDVFFTSDIYDKDALIEEFLQKNSFYVPQAQQKIKKRGIFCVKNAVTENAPAEVRIICIAFGLRTFLQTANLTKTAYVPEFCTVQENLA